jgi:metallo-beta-lactamase class B
VKNLAHGSDTSFLLTGPAGHVLIDGGYPGAWSLTIASLTQLGFVPLAE